MVILLDAGPLGLVTNALVTPEPRECNAWMESLLLQGIRVVVPEITDYEVRRELLRASKKRGIQRLDLLAARIGYLPISTDVMRLAAEFWADARRHGRPTAANAALDVDMILAAQAVVAGRDEQAIVATANVEHLRLFADARHWRDIR